MPELDPEFKEVYDAVLDYEEQSKRQIHPTLMEYRESIHLMAEDFYPCLCQVFAVADNENQRRLMIAFPGFFEILHKRHNASLGLLEGESCWHEDKHYTCRGGNLYEERFGV